MREIETNSTVTTEDGSSLVRYIYTGVSGSNSSYSNDSFVRHPAAVASVKHISALFEQAEV